VSATPSVESYSRSRTGTFARGDGFSFSARLARELRRTDGARWPDARYADDPVGFVEDVLHETPWTKQIELLEAVREHGHVAIKSGHKIGKSRVLAWIALWWFCTHEDARVLFTSSVERQVDEILWRELVMLIRRSGIELDCRPAEHAKTGLRAPDKREIVGLSAREAEAAAGTSGINVLYLVDEASGCNESLFAAFEGNLAGGGRMVLASNPTRTTGKFFAVFQEDQSVDNGGEWKTLTAASTETPNAKSGRSLVPGLATSEWCEARRTNWGEDSLDYKVRVLGEFPTNEERRMLTLHEVIEATGRWETTIAEGRLVIGDDPAGPGDGGDESAFAVKRGKKILGTLRKRSLKAEEHVETILALVAEWGVPGEQTVPHVNVDAGGPVGALVLAALQAFIWAKPRGQEPFTVSAIFSAARAEREPDRYVQTRDELHAAAERFIKDGGAIPPDDKLQSELHAPEWTSTNQGKLRATHKDEIRKMLGRSPDTFDAVALACWGVDSFAEHAAEVRGMVAREQSETQTRRVPRMDPYAAERTWRTR